MAEGENARNQHTFRVWILIGGCVLEEMLIEGRRKFFYWARFVFGDAVFI